MNGLHILGTGRAVPDQIITNDDLARRVDTNDEWIVARTGIRERRFAREGESLTQFTVAAARQALELAGMKPDHRSTLSLSGLSHPPGAGPS